MLARVSLGLLLSALVLGAWLFLGAEREPRAVRAGAGGVAAPASEDGLRVLDAPRAAGERSAQIAAASGEPAASRTAAAQDVRVLVRLERPELAGSWGGDWRFELQTWDERNDTVEQLARTADAEGRAEFVFGGAVHVDWARVVPPTASGCALAFVEEHVDLAAGEEHEIVLAPGPGGLLAGRVQDLDGRPAAGVRVHAYFDGSAWDLAEWQPGLVAAESDAAGRFRFPRLPAGEWNLCVEPGEWLAYRPPTGEVERGWNAVDVRVDGEFDGARLTVVRAQRFTLQVVDAAGAPVESAHVSLEPVQLLGGRMHLEPVQRPDPLQVFLAGEAAGREAENWIWPHGTLGFATRADGTARLVGVPGVWSLAVWGPFDRADRTPPALRARIELPGPDLTWTLDARFERYRGRLLDEAGAPLPGAWVLLRERGLQEGLSTQRSDDQGRFEFQWLRPGIAYELELRRTGWLTRTHAIVPAPAGEAEEELVLRRALDVQLQLVTTAATPLSFAWVEILALRPDDARPDERPAIEALLRSGRRRSDSRGRVSLRGVPAGELELGLRRNLAVFDGDGRTIVDAYGRVQTQDEIVHRWALRVPPAEQQLEVDVSAWPEPEPPALARHTGRIVDAATGRPVAGAQVFVRAQQGFRSGESDGEGRFDLRGLNVPHDLFVRADGYASATLAERPWQATSHEHEFALRPGDDSCTVVLVDRDGERLPTVRVALRDAEGHPLRSLWRSQDGELIFGDVCEALDGLLVLIGAPPGELELELALPPLDGLGRCRVTVAGVPTPQTLVGRLERSLDELRAELRARLEPGDAVD